MEYSNWLVIPLAAGLATVASRLWRLEPAMGTIWGNSMRTEHQTGRRQYARSMATAVVTALLLIPLLYAANGFYGNSFLVDAVLTTFWLWLGFTGATWYIRYGLEQRPSGRVLLAMSHELMMLEVMAVVIGFCTP